MSFFSRTVPVTSTLISMNERFSTLQHQAPRITAQLSPTGPPGVKPASARNRRFAEELERKLTNRVAQRLKQRSIQHRLGLGGGRLPQLRQAKAMPVSQRLGARGGRRGARNGGIAAVTGFGGLGIRGRNLRRGRGAANILRRTASTQSLQRSASMQSLQSLSGGGRRSRSRSRLRMDDPSVRPRPRSRSQNQVVVRGRSRSRGRAIQGVRSNSRLRQPQRGFRNRGGIQPRRGRSRSRSGTRLGVARGRGGGRGRGGRGRGRANISKEALDNELDQYMTSSKDTTDILMKVDN